MIKKLIKQNKFIFSFINSIRFSITKSLRPKIIYSLFNSKKPISNTYGLNRGAPIDRYYIENFIKNNEHYIKGNVLELLDNSYTKKFGKDIKRSDILDIDTKNKNATIYGDIRDLKNIKENQYDCIILTQVLQFIDNCPAAINECRRILKNGGVLLATMPSISRIDCVSGAEDDYWRFTTAGTKYLFKNIFSSNNTEVNSYGNVLMAINFLSGISLEEINKKDLDFNDINFPCVITVKAIKE